MGVLKEESAHPGLARRSTYTDTYSFVKLIGEGGQGKTELVKRKRDQKVLVRKVQKIFDMAGDIPLEMKVFEDVLTPHPSIVYFDHANYLKKDKSLVLYFEHCEGGDLDKHVPGKHYVSEDFIWCVFVQLASALAFLHYGISRKHPNSTPAGWTRVVHRDVKPGNVFLRRPITSKRPTPDVVLGDFGLATTEQETWGCGTYPYTGPEWPVVTKQGDVWGLGAIIHSLAHGQAPVGPPPRNWPSGHAAMKQWYCDPENKNPKPMSTRYSDRLNRNMMDCLTKDPNKRVNSKILLQNLLKEMPTRLTKDLSAKY